MIPKNITQEKLYCEKSDKNDTLLKILQSKKFNRAMVFCNTKQKSEDITD